MPQAGAGTCARLENPRPCRRVVDNKISGKRGKYGLRVVCWELRPCFVCACKKSHSWLVGEGRSKHRHRVTRFYCLPHVS